MWKSSDSVSIVRLPILNSAAVKVLDATEARSGLDDSEQNGERLNCACVSGGQDFQVKEQKW